MTSFTITPLTDHTGAEVVGLDFTQPIDADAGAALNQAFIDHHVLVMRDQHFAPDQFITAVKVFGELQPHDKKEQHVPGHPDVSYVSNDEFVNGRRIIPGETFHTDHSNHPRNTSTCIMPTTTCRPTPSGRSTASRRCMST